jgi:phosphoglycerate dehydrogenase-like enzyme
LLRPGVEVHTLPSPESAPPRLGLGQFVVAGFSRQGFLDVIHRLDGVRVVQAVSAGVDDIVGRLPEGATLCDGAGVHDASVAEWVVMAILASFRDLPQYVIDQQSGRWRQLGPDAGMNDIEGATVLILGYGSIGRSVEARLAPFGVHFLRVSRHIRDGVSSVADLPILLPQADIVVILLPLTPETRKSVDASFLSLMRPGGLLVNSSRGAIVDTEALIQALESGHIRAALDVTDPEPLPDGHKLWSIRNVLITPHIAGSVTKVYERAWKLIADQLQRYLDGKPLVNVVTEGY